MKRPQNSFILAIVAVIGLALAAFSLVSAANAAAPQGGIVPRMLSVGELPEAEGIYGIPGRPNERLRVHVYHPTKDVAQGSNKGKPGPTAPTLSCASTTTADPDSSAVTLATGWHLPSLWRYSLNTSSVPATVGATKFPAIAANSFTAWTNASADLGAAVTFSRGADTSITRATRDGVNVITWGRTSGSALAVTYTWYNTATGLASEIDTIFNKSFTWYWSDPALWFFGDQCAYQGVYDAENILTHELGHTMGLDDEYTTDFLHNTMYGYGATGEVKKNTPTTGDTLGLSAIY